MTKMGSQVEFAAVMVPANGQAWWVVLRHHRRAAARNWDSFWLRTTRAWLPCRNT